MSILDAIGNTPLVELTRINPNPRVRLLAKLEGSNPGGSVKDRIALEMVRDAVERNLLGEGRTILEATSGNTGIGLAMVGAALGYPVKLAMPECVSLERRRTLEAFGAELVLTEGCLVTDGAIRMAERIFEADPETYFLPDQFKNPANVLAHYRHTGREIWEQTGGAVDAFVAGLGTTGTVMGVGRRLKKHKPAVHGANPICPYEQPVEKLIAELKARGFHCAEFIPIRNVPEVLSQYVTAMRAASLVITAGTEHNTLDLLPVEPACLKGVPVPADAKEIFWEGACVVAAHQFLTLHGECGFVDGQGKPNPRYADAESRIAAFRALGETVIQRYLSSR